MSINHTKAETAERNDSFQVIFLSTLQESITLQFVLMDD